MTSSEIKKRILTIGIFYLIAIAFRYASNQTGLLSHINQPFLKIILQGIGPAIGALVVFKIFSITPRVTLFGNFRQKWVLLTIFWGIPVIALGALTFINEGRVSTTVIAILIYALLEEIGWRGFLQPALDFLPKFTGILIVTVLWFIWHLNFELTTANLIFFFVLLLGSWGMRSVANKTGSLIAISAFHAAYDLYAAVAQPHFVFLFLLGMMFLIWILTLIYARKLI